MRIGTVQKCVSCFLVHFVALSLAQVAHCSVWFFIQIEIIEREGPVPLSTEADLKKLKGPGRHATDR